MDRNPRRFATGPRATDHGGVSIRTDAARGIDAPPPDAGPPGAAVRAAVAGVVAAAAGLTAAQVVAYALPHGVSLVVAVGDRVIAWTPGPLVRRAEGWFGTGDKSVLLTATVLVLLALAARLGVLARRSPRGAYAGVTALVALGAAAALRVPRASGPTVLATAAAGALVGCLVLRWLVAPRAPLPTRVGVSPVGRGSVVDGGRRAFLSAVALTGAGTLAALWGSRWLEARRRVAAARAAVRLPPPAVTAPPVPVGAQLPVRGVSRLFTPNDDFYRIDTALVVPQVDVTSWQLEVRGRVRQPLRFSYDDLLRMPQVEHDITISCVSNEVGGDLVGNARWQGVLLRDLLERAGIAPGADQVVGRSVDGFTAGFPVSVATDGRPAMVALAMNGEPLPVAHGFPARLVVPGLYGYVSATKWLRSIEVTTFAALRGYWIPRGWARLGPIKTQSRIDTPHGAVPAGPTSIAGIAWAPHRGIRSVQVQVDDGPWRRATLGAAVNADTWRLWQLPWTATPGQHRLRVRATDGTGAVQPQGRTDTAPDGAEGWHTVVVSVPG